MTTLREAAEQALKWIEAQPEPRMFGARTAIQMLSAALAESEDACSAVIQQAHDKPAAWRFRPWKGAKHWAYSEWDPREFCSHDCEAEPLFI